MKRRTIALAGAGLAAAAAGAGWRWWSATGGASEPPPAFWSLRFERPEGGELALAGFRGRPLLLNFWATWCAPCIKEMPDLDRFGQTYGAQGWQVVGLAIDGPTPVREFLKKLPVRFPIGLAGLEGTDLARDLGNAQGGLPFTVVFDRQGRIAARKLGQTRWNELVAWAERS